MSAKMETFFELKKVVDHDCGNYRIGEIDFVDLDAIDQYVEEYGDFGKNEILDACVRIMFKARQAAIRTRASGHQDECMVAGS